MEAKRSEQYQIFAIEKIMLEEITGLSNFSNIRFEHNNKIFKKVLSTISGDFKFRLNPQNLVKNR